MRLLIFLCLFISSAYAAEKKQYAVETTNKVPEKLIKKYPHVQFKTPQDQARPDIAPLAERDQYFFDLGFSNELKTLDEADKDVLHWRLKNSSLAKLKNWYPTFPHKIWAQLQKTGKK